MSKQNHRDAYNIHRVNAENKIQRGIDLNSSEKMASEGKWFFTFGLDVESFDKVVELSAQYAIKPGQLVEMFVLKELQNL